MNDEFDSARLNSDEDTPAHGQRRELDELWHALSLVRERPALSSEESDRLLERIRRSTGRASRSEAASARRRAAILTIAFSTVAAAVALLFLLGDRPLDFRTAPGEQMAVDLPDGTAVVLNSDSRLVYKETRGGDRIATLRGEAWFHVSTTGSTFRVRTRNAVVTVLGTRFNVRNRLVAGRPVTDVRVAEGRVSLTSPDGATDGLVLSNDRSASIIGAAAVPVERPTDGEAGAPEWTRGDLVFRDMPYHEAVEEASRRLGVTIELTAIDLADRRINAAFRAPLETAVVLEGLCRPFGLRFRSTADGYEIYRPESELDLP